MVEWRVNLICAGALFLIGTNNLINALIDNNLTWLVLFQYVFCFWTIIPVCYFVKKTKLYAVIFSIAGVLVTIIGEDGNFSGIIFIIFGLYLFNSFKSNLIIIVMLVIVIGFKSYIKDYDHAQLSNIYIIHIFIISLYYILMHPKKKPEKRIVKIDYETEQCLHLLVNGYVTKEISAEVGLSPSAITKRFCRLRNQYNVKNNEQLVFALIQKGFFRDKEDIL